jgi:hypothetical protein
MAFVVDKEELGTVKDLGISGSTPPVPLCTLVVYRDNFHLVLSHKGPSHVFVSVLVRIAYHLFYITSSSD